MTSTNALYSSYALFSLSFDFSTVLPFNFSTLSARSVELCIDEVYGESLSLSVKAESPNSANSAWLAKSAMDVSGAAED